MVLSIFHHACISDLRCPRSGDISTLMPIEPCSLKDRLARAIESVAAFAIEAEEPLVAKCAGKYLIIKVATENQPEAPRPKPVKDLRH